VSSRVGSLVASRGREGGGMASIGHRQAVYRHTKKHLLLPLRPAVIPSVMHAACQRGLWPTTRSTLIGYWNWRSTCPTIPTIPAIDQLFEPTNMFERDVTATDHQPLYWLVTSGDTQRPFTASTIALDKYFTEHVLYNGNHRGRAMHDSACASDRKSNNAYTLINCFFAV